MELLINKREREVYAKGFKDGIDWARDNLEIKPKEGKEVNR